MLSASVQEHNKTTSREPGEDQLITQVNPWRHDRELVVLSGNLHKKTTISL